MYFDTHAHYDDEAFDSDREELLKSLGESGVEGPVASEAAHHRPEHRLGDLLPDVPMPFLIAVGPIGHLTGEGRA